MNKKLILSICLILILFKSGILFSQGKGGSMCFFPALAIDNHGNQRLGGTFDLDFIYYFNIVTLGANMGESIWPCYLGGTDKVDDAYFFKFLMPKMGLGFSIPVNWGDDDKNIRFYFGGSFGLNNSSPDFMDPSPNADPQVNTKWIGAELWGHVSICDYLAFEYNKTFINSPIITYKLYIWRVVSLNYSIMPYKTDQGFSNYNAKFRFIYLGISIRGWND